MAVTHIEGAMQYSMTEAGDEIALEGGLFVKSIRVVSDELTAEDDVQIVDPANTSDVIWETPISGTDDYAEAELIERHCRNGVRLQVNTGNRATVYVSYK